MAIILGLDPSQKTGWALYDTSAPLSSIRCGVLKFEAKPGEFEQNAGQLALALVKLLSERRDPATGKIMLPDFAAIEQAPRQQFGQHKKRGSTVKFMGDEIPTQGEEGEGGPGLQGTLSTNQMAAALAAVLGAYKVPFETLTDGAWRKHAYGFGKRAGWTRKEWKAHSRQMCAQKRIAATNDDMAEACWIAFAGKACDSFRLMQARAAEQAKREQDARAAA